MNDAPTPLAIAGVVLAPNGVVLAVRASYLPYDDEAANLTLAYDLPAPLG